MRFTVTHTIGRVPTFAELQNLAKEHDVQIVGDDQKGEFKHPKAAGKYTFEKNGDINGDFTGHHVLGIITGIFVIMTGNAGITINTRPFLMPEALLRSEILKQLTVFCAKFPPLN
jgi:hypothetical protein